MLVFSILKSIEFLDCSNGLVWRLIQSPTLESGIDVGQGINVGPGKLGKKNKRRALNIHVLCSE